MVDFRTVGGTMVKLVGGPFDGDCLASAPAGSVEMPLRLSYYTTAKFNGPGGDDEPAFACYDYSTGPGRVDVRAEWGSAVAEYHFSGYERMLGVPRVRFRGVADVVPEGVDNG